MCCFHVKNSAFSKFLPVKRGECVGQKHSFVLSLFKVSLTPLNAVILTIHYSLTYGFLIISLQVTIWLWLSVITWFSFHFLYMDYLMIMSSSVIILLPLNFIWTDYVMIMSSSVITWLPLNFIWTDYVMIMSSSVITWLPLNFIFMDYLMIMSSSVITWLPLNFIFMDYLNMSVKKL